MSNRLALLLLLGLSTPAWAADADATAPAAPSAVPAMTSAAQRWLASLSAEQQKRAILPLEHPTRADWHWIPKTTRKGVVLREMNPEQRKLALELLQASLSPLGLEKAKAIFHLEAVLKILEKDTRNIRDPEKYYFTIFGTPGATGPWGYSIEGHHLSLNYVIRDGRLASSTPTFMGANPRRMSADLDIGPKKGTLLLNREEELAFELLQSLTADQRSTAIVSAKPPRYLVSGPINTLHASGPVGLAVSKMTEPQRAILRRLLEVYAGNVVAEAGQTRLQEVDRDFDKIYFSWFGEPSLDAPHFYRVQGPTFVVEMDNTQSDPVGTKANHIHSVWRSPQTDFGLVRQP